jgi:hypothetical protein
MNITPALSIDALVEHYSGILDQDGWETLELTVYQERPRQAKEIIRRLELLQNV